MDSGTQTCYYSLLNWPFVWPSLAITRLDSSSRASNLSNNSWFFFSSFFRRLAWIYCSLSSTRFALLVTLFRPEWCGALHTHRVNIRINFLARFQRRRFTRFEAMRPWTIGAWCALSHLFKAIQTKNFIPRKSFLSLSPYPTPRPAREKALLRETIPRSMT